MYAESPFLVRRVLAGVFVAVALIAAGCLVWAHVRIGHYRDQENRMVAHYRALYETCERTQGSYGSCADRMVKMCAADPFWSSPQPFSFGLGADLPDSTVSCVFGDARSS